MLDNMLDVDTIPREQTKIKPTVSINKPPQFKVIYVNDNETSMQFVVDSLIGTFGYNESNALGMTEDISTKGSAVVAVLPYEIAEQKGIEVTVKARGNGYPLQVKLEADE